MSNEKFIIVFIILFIVVILVSSYLTLKIKIIPTLKVKEIDPKVDTSIKSLETIQQEMEDNKHYNNYERQRLEHDKSIMIREYDKTKDFITYHLREDELKLIDSITFLELLLKYNNYIVKHRVLFGDLNKLDTLTLKEFIIRTKYSSLFWKKDFFIKTRTFLYVV